MEMTQQTLCYATIKLEFNLLRRLSQTSIVSNFCSLRIQLSHLFKACLRWADRQLESRQLNSVFQQHISKSVVLASNAFVLDHVTNLPVLKQKKSGLIECMFPSEVGGQSKFQTRDGSFIKRFIALTFRTEIHVCRERCVNGLNLSISKNLKQAYSKLF